MATLVIVLRAVSLLAFAAPMLLTFAGRRSRRRRHAHRQRNDHAPVAANFAAFALFLLSLLLYSASADGSTALLLASSGSLLAVAGTALVVKARLELGSAWSFVPGADHDRGLITAGPYRLVRHPIYLGLAGLALGQALAFGSWPAILVVLVGVVPTFAWRARAEEKLLSHSFGEAHTLYRARTGMIIPRVARRRPGG